ncbi:fungal specific transcription factor [Colletotrichum kahawae]|uniref:Fungal specific transcription factor n=1 Tax=Colletotrichum kahawae TaxID=34407 RepID=A0AAD9YHD2_COLKA|nr:fungal specific transcription factor [Colletotrichum kahawae]
MVHPSHQPNLTSPSRTPPSTQRGFFVNLVGSQNTLMQVCESLELTIDSLQKLTDAYFNRMMAFTLFHEPSFGDKIQSIKDSLHLKALMASIFSISARFNISSDSESSPTSTMPNWPSHAHFHRLAKGFIDEALDGCDDEPPPICVTQALVLCTFYELARGVRGHAWRLLGTCVRVAYEQRLHLIDSMTPGPTKPPSTQSELLQWSGMEERRRLWWVIWQMDAFASTVRKSPTAIDQAINETYLPVSDDFWFQNKYQPSCFLDPIPTERSKRLLKSGNNSDMAWFVVVNSIMRDAQVLARGNIHGALSDLMPGDDEGFHSLKYYFHGHFRKTQSSEDGRQLSLLIRALQQTVAALPGRLSYQGGYLSFGDLPSGDNPAQPRSEPREDSAQHAVFLMSQLARFMIYHHLAFSEILLGTIFSESGGSPSFEWSATPRSERERLSNSEGLRSCLEASDNIYAVIRRSSETHIEWTNPFLASTVWLAASLQILRKVFAPSTCGDLSEQESKIEVLRGVCQRYTDFWDTPRSLLHNLDSLEERLLKKKAEIAAMEAQSALCCEARNRGQQSFSVSAGASGRNPAENFRFATGIGPVINLSQSPVEPQFMDQGHGGGLSLSPYTSMGREDWMDSRRDSLGNMEVANYSTGNMEMPYFSPSEGFTGFPEADQELSLFISTLVG